MTVELGKGFYSLADASRLTGLKPSRAREWFRGRGTDQDTVRPPVFQSDYEPIDGDYAICFLDPGRTSARAIISRHIPKMSGCAACCVT
jgi:hypothetical protein